MISTRRLRSRAAYYRREAARARTRPRLVFYRALATHLEREAIELERIKKRDEVKSPSIAGTRQRAE
jgi:hypothetical protein